MFEIDQLVANHGPQHHLQDLCSSFTKTAPAIVGGGN